ncbi:thiol peroxidase [Niabella drilacis]|uniref:Thiol peroxidase n=1 Tax=Niabella drilacis (strain DSM 25811 / CCM 8410 / CCUG 62505 / LMG 26954 / E90) TaxID=1285928 RepID=A0A1G6U250_NIADE|nr:thiol peroxidase [Niabella drilacis]SDD34677.1 thiol peroxidase, atypical 2-Cys peroxiredoxin [Niabella drilacis]
MAEITLKGNPVTTVGTLPEKGSKLKDFTLVNAGLAEKKLADYAGKKVVLNIFPSVDTGVCAASVRKFNEKAAALDNTVVLNISKDLPFALNRFCAAEGISNVETLSDFRGHFGDDYGVTFADSPMKGLLSRAVIVANPDGEVVYTEQVPEITTEPDYEAALAALN